MSEPLRAFGGDQFRIICRLCETIWSTCELPAECPTCAAIVTVTARKQRAALTPAKVDEAG